MSNFQLGDVVVFNTGFSGQNISIGDEALVAIPKIANRWCRVIMKKNGAEIDTCFAYIDLLYRKVKELV